MKPIASSTRSAWISNSLPAHAARTALRPSFFTISTLTACSARHVPVASPTNRSRRDRDTDARRLLRARSRRGRSAATAATDCRPRASPAAAAAARADAPTRAPWRCAVPEAVGAGIAAADDDHVLALRGDELGVGNRGRPRSGGSAASGTPSRSGCPSARARAPADRAADRRRRRAAPRRSRRAAGSTGTSTPTLTPARNTTPSASISASRRSRMRFSILNSGMP